MRRALVLATMLGLACGGESQRDRPSGSSGRGTAEGGGFTNGSSGVGGSAVGGSSGEKAVAQAGKTYVPEDSNVPAAGDGRLEGGSFEGNLGSGWDFCFSKHPGAAYVDASGSSDGVAWLTFDSHESCSDSFACQADGDDVQVGFWPSTPLPPGVPVHLYFDAINLGPASPSGILHIDAMLNGCMSTAPLATIRLQDLELTSNWTTRCVSFTPDTAVGAFGLFVVGDAFQLGLDAFRFGPECGTD